MANAPWAQGSLSDPESMWPTQFFPVMTTSYGAVTCDCSVAGDDPTPMRFVTWEAGPAPTPATRSFGEMVEWWIDALATGGWAFDATLGHFTRIWERLDPHRRATDLV
jgi:hypothetical protein